MKKSYATLGPVVLVYAIAAVIIPILVAPAGTDMPGAGWDAVVKCYLCFAAGGGLMFLILFSDRRG